MLAAFLTGRVLARECEKYQECSSDERDWLLVPKQPDLASFKLSVCFYNTELLKNEVVLWGISC